MVHLVHDATPLDDVGDDLSHRESNATSRASDSDRRKEDDGIGSIMDLTEQLVTALSERFANMQNKTCRRQKASTVTDPNHPTSEDRHDVRPPPNAGANREGNYDDTMTTIKYQQETRHKSVSASRGFVTKGPFAPTTTSAKNDPIGSP